MDEFESFSSTVKTAVLVSLLVGLLANQLIVHLVGGVDVTVAASLMAVFWLSLLLSVVYLLFYQQTFKPWSARTFPLRVHLVYNRVTGTVIDDPFSSYAPQKIGWQVFTRYKDAKGPGSTEELRKLNALPAPRRHILTDLMEYLVLFQIRQATSGLSYRIYGEELDSGTIPPTLLRNRFISFLQRAPKTDIVTSGMAQISPYLPNGFTIEHNPRAESSTADAFTVALRGKHTTVAIRARLTSQWPIQTMTSGPAPIFEDVYINPYFQGALCDQLGQLMRATFEVVITCRHRLRWWFFRPSNDREWTDRFVRRFVRDKFFGYFDYDELVGASEERLRERAFQACLSTAILSREIMDDTRTMSKRLEPPEPDVRPYFSGSF